MARKVYIKTFGCQMNEYDSAKMADVLHESHGLAVASTPEEADVLLLNTCSVREKAQEKVFSQLGMWRPLKEQRPDVIIGVGGCVASQEGEAIQKRAPYVDVVFGPLTLHRLPELINEVQRRRAPVVDISFDAKGAKKFGMVTTDYGPMGPRNNAQVGRQLAIIMDGTLYSAPVIREPIHGGRAEISG